MNHSLSSIPLEKVADLNPSTVATHSAVVTNAAVAASPPNPSKLTLLKNPMPGRPLVLDCEAGIMLKVGKTVLRILPNGELQLNGSAIRLEAEGTVVINASQVRVNSEDHDG